MTSFNFTISKMDFRKDESPIVTFILQETNTLLEFNVNTIQLIGAAPTDMFVRLVFNTVRCQFTLDVPRQYIDMVSDIYQYRVDRFKVNTDWKQEFNNKIGWLPCLN